MNTPGDRPTHARRSCTGESHRALVAPGGGECAIPAAECRQQAALESDVLLKGKGLGGLTPYPLGIVGVRPEPHRLTVRLLKEPFVIAHWAMRLLPFFDSADDSPADAVGGVPGLRSRIDGNHVRLTRPGTTASVRLTGFNPRWWTRAVAAGRPGELYEPLFELPDWSRAERIAAQLRLPVTEEQDPRVGSAILRRIRATTGPGTANGTDVWVTTVGNRVDWSLETTDGPSCRDLLRLFTQAPTGAGWRVDFQDCHCADVARKGSCRAKLLTDDPKQVVHYSNLRWQRLTMTPDSIDMRARCNAIAFRASKAEA
ncbi:hypothetical protein [Embleya hyalina]|uniref:Uncharacterized protein n=1 Tax=Embleya hyalina TaxID=516124 RepID=A0A401YYQ8_9ACTN|nr:hypothetical protein [Embleya hyalina]GCD99766.1 hypothetical protein EHYA_07488 [Embleya hyalina]